MLKKKAHRKAVTPAADNAVKHLFPSFWKARCCGTRQEFRAPIWDQRKSWRLPLQNASQRCGDFVTGSSAEVSVAMIVMADRLLVQIAQALDRPVGQHGFSDYRYERFVAGR